MPATEKVRFCAIPVPRSGVSWVGIETDSDANVDVVKNDDDAGRWKPDRRRFPADGGRSFDPGVDVEACGGGGDDDDGAVLPLVRSRGVVLGGGAGVRPEDRNPSGEMEKTIALLIAWGRRTCTYTHLGRFCGVRVVFGDAGVGSARPATTSWR